ncbi:hypothetical protein ACVJGD_000455 [Bradyrhizobium sp. USDA 10063]
MAKARTVDPRMIDHIVSLKSNCARQIRATVCYLGSDRCNEVDLAPYKRVDTILGTMRGINYFKYVVRQR